MKLSEARNILELEGQHQSIMGKIARYCLSNGGIDHQNTPGQMHTSWFGAALEDIGITENKHYGIVAVARRIQAWRERVTKQEE